VGVTGHVGRTDRGRLTLYAHTLSLLSPCLHDVPKDHFGLKDPDFRWRHRHLDMMINNSVISRLTARAKIVQSIRQTLEAESFLEVETPMLAHAAGGATARAFETTAHGGVKAQRLYLRIAPELWLKRMVIGGMHRVFEIGKCFRDEGTDLTHHPEFTTVEAYAAFWCASDMMDLTERVLENTAKAVLGGESYVPLDSGHQVNFQGPYKYTQ